ncbi:gamma conglutin 1-like [Bidens hawaiensis]|uniref:gamma conglutin 1-like n=1 Tax=Bidens hawaiensis TaxID=980011 RepID=UPI00404B211C
MSSPTCTSEDTIGDPDKNMPAGTVEQGCMLMDPGLVDLGNSEDTEGKVPRFHSTDGRTAVPYANAIFPNSACAPSSAFDSFPKEVRGVLALSDSSHALPRVSSSGVLFIGRGPYYLDSHSDVDVGSLLSYTPLLKNQDTFGYYIGVNTIVIKKRSIDIPANATTKVTKRLQQSKPIAPFGLCYKIITNDTRAGLKVPNIDFGLPDGKKWSVSTANSMKQVTKDVACLAFVDGGATTEHAVMIGTFQMEDNFLLFDLVNSTFGFSSSLLNKGTSCASFNFTGI